VKIIVDTGNSNSLGRNRTGLYKVIGSSFMSRASFVTDTLRPDRYRGHNNLGLRIVAGTTHESDNK
jgi:hypothetical protein